MENIITVLVVYFSFYFLFTFLGLGVTQSIFRSRTFLASLLAPLFGFALFSLISTALMHYLAGAIAGQLGFLLTALISLFLILIEWQLSRITIKNIVKYQWTGLLSGLIFLLPLFVVADIGIFALNGADFGSYAGWGKYFQEYTLRDTLPHTTPINTTLQAFINLQNEITLPDGRWRIGNISVFTALNSLFPAYWPIVYMACIAFLIGQFTIAIQLFTRVVLFQTQKRALILGFLSIFLTTVMWLAASHYTPNIIGLDYTLLLISLYLLTNRFNMRWVIGISIPTGGLILLYPESFAFFPFLLLGQFLVRNRIFSKRTFITGVVFILSMGLASFLTYDSFFHCLRHFFGIMGYNRPGDYVGIDFWAYPSQGLGFIDYNAVLRPESKWLRLLLVVNYLAALTLLLFGIMYKPRTKQETLQKRTYLMLFACLLILVVPIVSYLWHEHYLVAWRTLLTISPYTWLLLCIAALNAFALYKISSAKFIRTAALCAVVIFFSDIAYRVHMIKSIAFGSAHGAIFGEGFQKSTAYLETNRGNYDIAFIDYQGSGTIQGGWEFYAQNLSYLFPQAGIGRNEFASEPLRGKRVVILSDNYVKIHHLTGFNQNIFNFNGQTLSFTENNNVLLPYSNSWVYFKEPIPRMSLPGLPGKLLLWLQKPSRACLNIAALSSRGDAVLDISFNGNKPIRKTLEQLNNQERICYKFKRGLNEIRLAPTYASPEMLALQKNAIEDLKQIPTLELTEQQRALLSIYKPIKPVNPLSSPSSKNDWNGTWNLIMPPDSDPFNPHVVFSKIEVERA